MKPLAKFKSIFQQGAPSPGRHPHVCAVDHPDPGVVRNLFPVTPGSRHHGLVADLPAPAAGGRETAVHTVLLGLSWGQR